MRGALKYAGIGIVTIAIGIQFIRPNRSNPPVDPAKDLLGNSACPPAVRAVLERSCVDCHSHLTRWPWYSGVAPVSWLVAHDVNTGRRHLNFSEWEGYKNGRRVAKLESLLGEVDKGTMPPGSYLVMHGNATLSPADRDLVLRWAEGLSDSLNAAGR